MTDAAPKKKRPSEAAQALMARLNVLADEVTPEVYRREARLLCENEPAAGKWTWRLELARRAWASSPKRKDGRPPPRLCKPPKEKVKRDPEVLKRIAHHRACLAEIGASRRLAVVPAVWLDKQAAYHRASLKDLGAEDE